MSEPEGMEPPSLLLIVSAPSGAGKSTLIARLLAAREDFALSVSHTTREPRGAEQQGVDYHFVAPGEFARLDAESGFVEQAEVHGHRYGTSRAEIARHQAAGRHVVLDVDVQGARQLRSALPEARSVFVLPPSLSELERRLRARGTDAADVIERRLGRARAELEAASEYDYIVINDHLDRATQELIAIASAELARATRRRAALRALVGAPRSQSESA